MSRTAQRDSANLGYFIEDVTECLLSLKEENFLKSKTYQNNGHQTTCDAYRIKFTGPSGTSDELYVKFSFNGRVAVLSFHLQR